MFSKRTPPWRADLERYASQSPEQIEEYAAGHAPREQREALAGWLERAGLYYWLGRDMNRWIPENKLRKKRLETAGHKEAAEILILPHRGRPKMCSDWGLIGIMAQAWKMIGQRPGTAYDGVDNRDTPSPFQRFVDGWLRIIDPSREELPSRKLYRDVLDDLKQKLPGHLDD